MSPNARQRRLLNRFPRQCHGPFEHAEPDKVCPAFFPRRCGARPLTLVLDITIPRKQNRRQWLDLPSPFADNLWIQQVSMERGVGVVQSIPDRK